MNMNPLTAAMESIELGPEVVIHNLTMIPLMARHAPAASEIDYLVLDEALASGLVEITELSAQGSVPELRLINRGAKPVLVVDGEELLGAKQNRVVNLTILVAAHSELTIPVSCVEAGRWRARSRSFTAAPRTQYVSGRAKRMDHVSRSLVMRGERVSDQAEVWKDIAQKSFRMKVESPTSAMDEIFRRHTRSLDTFVAGLQPVESQVGAVFAIGGRVVGFDLFDRPSTLRRMLPKLVQSAAIDAIDASESPEGTDDAPKSSRITERVTAFLARTASAPQHSTPALGLGEDRRLTTAGLAGAALVLDQHVVHLGAFAL